MSRSLYVWVLLFAAALAAFPRSAIALEVRLSLQASSCEGEAGPSSSEEWSKVEAAWLGEGSLRVVAWAVQLGSAHVDASSATVALEGDGTVRLSYSMRQPRREPNAPVVLCAEPVKLIFLVQGLARSSYSLIVEERGERLFGRVDG